MRLPQKTKRVKVDGARKRKASAPKKKPATGIKTGHFLKFISKVLDNMDKIPNMKGFYIVMNNCSIHTGDEVIELITSRGYNYEFLPPYSPELNPIEQFWAKVKATVSRSKFNNDEDLKTRITEACNQVPVRELKAYVQHSVNTFEKCKNYENI
jgi:transposase